MTRVPKTRVGPVLCPYCRAQIKDDLWRCARCATPHHQACAHENGRCTIMGCGFALASPGSAPPPPPPPPPPPLLPPPRPSGRHVPSARSHVPSAPDRARVRAGASNRLVAGVLASIATFALMIAAWIAGVAAADRAEVSPGVAPVLWMTAMLAPPTVALPVLMWFRENWIESEAPHWFTGHRSP